MKRYLFAIDMDSTLLNDKKEIPVSTERYLTKLQKEGHIVMLASGRPFRSLERFYNAMHLNSPVICYNGAFCFHPYDENFKSAHFTFPKELVKEIYNDCGDAVDNVMCETNDIIWAREYDDELAKFFGVQSMNIIYGDINETLNEDPWTLLMRCTDVSDVKERITKATEKHPGYEIRFWFKASYCEVYNTSFSKAACLRDVAKYYNIPMENVVAIGDASNDIEMVKEAGIGVAMINGMDQLKNIAQIVTKRDNNHQGVKQVIKEIIKEQL